MGKVRIKTLGIEEEEQEQKQKAKVKKEEKTLRQAQGKRKTAKGAHGGERVVSMAPTEEEFAKIEGEKGTEETKELVSLSRSGPEEKKKTHPPRKRGREYREKLVLVDRTKTYPISQALELLRKASFAKFDGTVELHINTLEKGIQGTASLPHSIGKKMRVGIASDDVLSKIEKGQIDFDILLASPSMMLKIARVAKILGPRGLMPNPKNGTITDDPEGLALSLTKGNQLRFKTETQAPIIHLVIGKLSAKDKELEENIMTLIQAIGTNNIKNITIKSTMSPGIKVDTNSLS